MFVPIYQDSNLYVALSMVDTDPSSPTFNQVVDTLTSGIQGFGLGGAVATPDGKYVYVNAFDRYADPTQSYIHVFDIVHGTVTTHTADSLGGAGEQTEMIVSPDGQSLLLSGSGATYGSIVVLDIGNDPKNPTQVTSIRGMAPAHVGGGGNLTPVSWKVVGDHLFTLDSIKSVVAAFNFDRVHSNFTQIAAYALPVQAHSSNIVVSPDGLLIYVPLPDYDSIAVLDANRLVSGQDPLITNIGAFRAPVQLTVSPVSQLSRALRDDR